MTLEQIIIKEKEHRHENGAYGIKACKEAILWDEEHLHKDLLSQLNHFVARANNDAFFNRTMVLACWELLQERMA